MWSLVSLPNSVVLVRILAHCSVCCRKGTARPQEVVVIARETRVNCACIGPRAPKAPEALKKTSYVLFRRFVFTSRAQRLGMAEELPWGAQTGLSWARSPCEPPQITNYHACVMSAQRAVRRVVTCISSKQRCFSSDFGELLGMLSEGKGQTPRNSGDRP